MTAAEPIIDPEFRDLIPALRPDELDDLRASIEEHGCMDALRVWSSTGILVDGHNRLAICRDLGVSYAVKRMAFKDRDAVRAFIIRHQLARRNLKPSQRAHLAALMPARLLGRPAKPKTPSIEGVSAEEAASTHGVGHASVERARKVLREGVPELSDAVRDGTIAVSMAEKCLALDEDTQREIAAGGREVATVKLQQRKDKQARSARAKAAAKKAADNRERRAESSVDVAREDLSEVMSESFRDTPQAVIRRAWKKLTPDQKRRLIEQLLEDADLGEVGA